MLIPPGQCRAASARQGAIQATELSQKMKITVRKGASAGQQKDSEDHGQYMEGPKRKRFKIQPGFLFKRRRKASFLQLLFLIFGTYVVE